MQFHLLCKKVCVISSCNHAFYSLPSEIHPNLPFRYSRWLIIVREIFKRNFTFRWSVIPHPFLENTSRKRWPSRWSYSCFGQFLECFNHCNNMFIGNKRKSSADGNNRLMPPWVSLIDGGPIGIFWRIQRGRQGNTPPPSGSKFFHFHAVFGKKWQKIG